MNIECWWFVTTTKLHVFNDKTLYLREVRKFPNAHLSGGFEMKECNDIATLFNKAEDIKKEQPYVTEIVVHFKS